MPIAVFIHGGSWTGGTAYGDASISPTSCVNANTVMCALAAAGYAVYSINYTLAVSKDVATQWPIQWQDCDCFFKFLAEQAGVTVPGNPNRIYVIGHSSGAHLAAMVTLAPHTAFPPNCTHTSTNYTIRALALLSPPLDLRQLYMGMPGAGIEGGVTNLLGCSPTEWATPDCIRLTQTVNPASYVAQNQPPIQVQTGLSDAKVLFFFQGALQSAYAGLNPSVNITWVIHPAPYGHDLDFFLFNPCSDDPTALEPSPCGSLGQAYQSLATFFAMY